MRIYTNIMQAVRETERDLYELGVDVHPQTMQDKNVAEDPEYLTREVSGYAFKLVDCTHSQADESQVINYCLKDPQDAEAALRYIEIEFCERISGQQLNPGTSHLQRPRIWQEFLHEGKFHYTYSERIAPQIRLIISELSQRPDTRQAIINIHTNICPGQQVIPVYPSQDLYNMGGKGRIPCSMYYQLMRRAGKLDIIYTMRSCDFLTHFPIDLMLAMRLQQHIAYLLNIPVGTFTYFAGSLHAYYKDLKTRGIF